MTAAGSADIEYKCYPEPTSSEYSTGTVRGRIFVLAANAIENARLMLASGLAGTSGLVGRNLMDHAYLLSLGAAARGRGHLPGDDLHGRDRRSARRVVPPASRPDSASTSTTTAGAGRWARRTPTWSTSSTITTNSGASCAASWSPGSPASCSSRSWSRCCPTPSNRVTVDPRYTDQLGNMRPVVTYSIPDYTMRGVAYARQICAADLPAHGAADYTMYDPTDYGYVSYEGQGYVIRGGNHLAGTHIMGTSPRDSVVDATSARGTTRTSTWSAAAACRRSAPRTSR